MSVDAQIRDRLAALDPQRVELVDDSEKHRGHGGWRPGGGTHWRLTIVSPRFRGMATLARHRLVYGALGELMKDPIHALEITARAPEESGATPRQYND